MATYSFESITSAQALNFNGATDTLAFLNPTSSAHLMTVTFDAATATSPATVTLIDGATGRLVTFGPGIEATTPNVSLVFQDSSELRIGTTGNDGPVVGGTTSDALFGNAGDDTLNGGAGNDVIQGNAGNDSLVGGGGSDTIYGGKGNDSIDVGHGGANNFVEGNSGDDSITDSGGGASTLLGGQGDDSIAAGTGGDYLSGDLGNDSISGGGGDDSFAGGGGNDVLIGGAGNDTFSGGPGADTITGGGGSDTIIFAPGDSVPVVGNFDQVIDWNGSLDHLLFGLGAASPNNLDLINTAATDIANAIAQATAIIGGGTYVAIPMGGNLLIFADTNHDHAITTADNMVMLVGRALSDINFSSISG